MAALTVTPEPFHWPPRNTIEITGLSGATANVDRITSDGNRTPIRSAEPATLGGGTWSGYDYEAPYLERVAYAAASNTGDTAASDPVTLDVQTPWLIHPGVPDYSLPIPGVLLPDEDVSEIAGGVMWAMGRAEGVPENDGVRHTPTFELVIRTGENRDIDPGDETAWLSRLLADGSALLMQVAYDWTDVTEYRWINPSTVHRARRSRDLSDLSRNFTMDCTEVAAPTGLLQAQWTYGAAEAVFATYGDAKAAYATYGDATLDRRR